MTEKSTNEILKLLPIMNWIYQMIHHHQHPITYLHEKHHFITQTQTRTDNTDSMGFDETEVSEKLSITGLLGLVRMPDKAQSFMAFAAADEDTQTFDF